MAKESYKTGNMKKHCFPNCCETRFSSFSNQNRSKKRTLNAGNDQKHKTNKKQKQTFAKQITKRVLILKKNPKIVVLKVIAIAVAAATESK